MQRQRRKLAARGMPESASVTSALPGLEWSWQNRSRIQTQLKGVGVADERRSGAVQPEDAQVLRHRMRAVGDRQAHGTRQAKPAFATGDRGAPQGVAAVLRIKNQIEQRCPHPYAGSSRQSQNILRR